MMGILPNRLLAIVLALLCASTVVSAQSDIEPVVLDLRIGRVAARTTFALRSGDVAWLPTQVFAELTEFGYEEQGAGVILSHDLSGRYSLNAGAGLRRTESGWMVRVDTLASVLGLEIPVDWQELRVVVLNPGRLPIGLRKERELRRQIMLAADQRVRPTAKVRRPTLDGLTLEYGIGLATAGTPATWSVTTGTSVLGGGLSITTAGGNQSRVDASWTTAWLDKAWLAQLRLGDGLATGPNPRTLRGVSISNAQLMRSEDLGTLPVSGSVGSEWQVEAWRGGRLVGVQPTDAMGRFRFDVPVQIGENPVEIIAYGPGGQVRQMSRLMSLDERMVSPGRLEYAGSVGGCRTDRCDATMNADLGYGLGAGWSGRAGIDGFIRDSSDLMHPYVGIVGHVGRGLWLEADQIFSAASRATLRFQPDRGFNARIEATKFASGTEDPILTPASRLNQVTGTVFWAPGGDQSSSYLEMAVEQVVDRTGTASSARLSGSVNTGQLRLMPQLRLSDGQGSRPSVTAGVSVLALPYGTLPGLIGRAMFRAQLEGSADGLETVGLWASTRATRGLRLDAGATWRRNSGTTVTLRSSAELGGTRIYNTVNRDGEGRLSASPFIRGGISLDPNTGSMVFSPEPIGNRSGVSGRIWLDEDGDGIFGPDEYPAVGVRLVIGNMTARTDRDGFYNIMGLAPYVPVAVTVDSTTLPSPLHIARVPPRGIAVAPHRSERLDLPLQLGGIVDGRFEEADLSPAAGVEIEFVHLATGEKKSSLTFTDGGVYMLGMRPGEWTVSAGPGASRTIVVVGGRTTPVRIRRPAP